MFDSHVARIILTLVTFLASLPLASARELEVDLVVRDTAGQPVANAAAALNGIVNAENSPNPQYYSSAPPTDAEGRTHLSADHFRDSALIYLRHKDRNLAGLVDVAKQKHTEPVEITLGPACRVHGKLLSSELASLGQQVTWTNVYLFSADGWHRPLSYMGQNQSFEFFVPPGKYQLKAYGTQVGQRTVAITVNAGQESLEVDPIDLPATALAKLIGRPAPELRNIVGWANCEPTTLADLKGKVVLLDFWGYWCGPCIGEMPELMRLHDDYTAQGLVVIALHDASVDSLAAMQERLAPMVAKRWSCREIPFPLALDGGAAKLGSGQGATTRHYGINSFPTTILIDRDGNVAGQFHASSETSIALLREKLGLPAVAAKDEVAPWRPVFDAAYRLDAGQVLKRVATAVPPDVRAAFITYCQTHGSEHQYRIDRLTAIEGSAEQPWSLIAGEATLGRLMRSLIPESLPRSTVECPPELGQISVPGDWTVRGGASLAERLQALETILNSELKLNLSIEPRKVKRDALVITGEYRIEPLPNATERTKVNLTVDGADLDNDFGGGSGNVTDLAGFLSRRMDRPVLNESTTPLDVGFEWVERESTLSGLSDDPAKVAGLLAMLEKQTGLKFEQTRREVEVWFVKQAE